MNSRMFCTFYIGNLFIGIEASRVQEITKTQKITHIPRAPTHIKGLLNLRGQIVTAIDLAKKLHYERVEGPGSYFNVIVRGTHEIAALLVDRIGDVLQLEDKLSEGPPPTIDNEIKDLLERVYKLDQGILMVLDLGKTIEVA